MMSLKSSSFDSLPFDLVEEILARVSASSLKRLRTTCKQWNVLLSDQRFTKKHFDKAEKQFRVAMLRRRTVCSMSLNLFGLHDNIDPSIEVKFNLMMAFVFEVFHCSGLLLCKTWDDRLLVWNLCMGQPKWIKTNNDDDGNYRYALGYENNKSCYNYKILKYDLDETFDMEIYEFSSNSWRVLNTPDFKIALNANGVSIMGNSYWLASHKEEEDLINDFLISFDFTTEIFGPRVSLPFKGYSFSDTISLSCIREDRLSVFFQDNDTSKMEIWMTNNITQTKAMSWSPFFKIDLNTNTHRFGTELSFFIDEENKVIVCCDEDEDEDDDMNDFVCIIGEDQYWRKVDIGQKTSRPRIFRYAPSLLRI